VLHDTVDDGGFDRRRAHAFRRIRRADRGARRAGHLAVAPARRPRNAGDRVQAFMHVAVFKFIGRGEELLMLLDRALRK
jgi:hypothetical protein